MYKLAVKFILERYSLLHIVLVLKWFVLLVVNTCSVSARWQSSDEPRTPAVLQRSLEPRAEAARCARSQPLLGTFNLFTWKTPPQTTTTVDSNNRLRHASIVVFGERREHPRQQLMRPLLYLIEWWQMSISTLDEEQISVWRWFNISRTSRWVDLARARSCIALIIAFMSRQDHYHCRPTGPVYCSSTSKRCISNRTPAN